jgi:Uma2 family endonuclease
MNAPARIHANDADAATSPTPYKLRVADYLMLEKGGSFGGNPTELIDGAVYMMSPEWRPHFRVKSELAYRMRSAVEAAGLPCFVGTEGSVALSDTDMPLPDILLTTAPDGEGPIPGTSVPLLVEVAVTSYQQDVDLKAKRYALASVPEYWVIDINDRKVHLMWSPESGEYREREEFALGEVIASRTISGLTVSTAGL